MRHRRRSFVGTVLVGSAMLGVLVALVGSRIDWPSQTTTGRSHSIGPHTTPTSRAAPSRAASAGRSGGAAETPSAKAVQAARDAVKTAPVKPPHSDVKNPRSRFRHWLDADRHGWTKTTVPNTHCDTRQAALARDGRHVRVDPHTCTIESGTWRGPYTGKRFTNPHRLDIDHLVPIGEAWRAGADRWSAQRRTRYANDPRVVVATSASANRSKGDDTPAEWKPDNRRDWCAYSVRWAQIKHAYQLNYTSQKEKKATQNMINTCPHQGGNR